jgi:hypothetical protein
MRDRTKSRRYSPEKEAFRREHERRRGFGLVQRHSRKLRELHGGDGIVALTAAMLGRADPRLAQQASPPVVEPPVAQVQRPVAQAEQPVTQVQRPVAQAEQPPTRAEQPLTRAEQPLTRAEQPPTRAEQPVAEGRPPVTRAEPPVAQVQPSGARVSGAERSAPSAAVQASSPMAVQQAGPVTANANLAATRAPIRRRVCPFDRGVFRREAGNHNIPERRYRKSISGGRWGVRDGRHPP